MNSPFFSLATLYIQLHLNVCNYFKWILKLKTSRKVKSLIQSIQTSTLKFQMWAASRTTSENLKPQKKNWKSNLTNFKNSSKARIKNPKADGKRKGNRQSFWNYMKVLNKFWNTMGSKSPLFLRTTSKQRQVLWLCRSGTNSQPRILKWHFNLAASAGKWRKKHLCVKTSLPSSWDVWTSSSTTTMNGHTSTHSFLTEKIRNQVHFSKNCFQEPSEKWTKTKHQALSSPNLHGVHLFPLKSKQK